MRKRQLSKVLPTMTVLVFAMRSRAAGSVFAFVPGGTLDPTTIPKYVDPLPIRGVMPITSVIQNKIDYYEIAVRQFEQRVLSTGLPTTKVWGYGAISNPSTFHYPAFTKGTFFFRRAYQRLKRNGKRSRCKQTAKMEVD